MNIEKMREEFQAEWSRKSGWSDMQLEIFRTGDDYSDQSTSSAWWAWQASRAAIEVELPAPHNDYSISDRDVSGACEQYKRDRKAIESLGLKIKVKS